MPLLINIAAALGIAFCGGLLFRRLGLPTLVGYLLAGVAIGLLERGQYSLILAGALLSIVVNPFMFRIIGVGEWLGD